MQLKTKFGQFGGVYAPEILVPALEELETAFIETTNNEVFTGELASILHDYAGRKTPLTFAENISKDWGAKIFLKREDLLHGGAHKTNNALGQALMAKYMGKTRLIAETGAGQHGVAVAMAGALFNLPVHIYMGSRDILRQHQNVLRMELMGANVHSVDTASQTLKDAINEAIRDWISNLDTTHYVLGTAAGPHPFPTIVKHFQSVIGDEIHLQFKQKMNLLPDAIVACIGGGSNAIGAFNRFIKETEVKLVGVEPGGRGIGSGLSGAVIEEGKPGCLHGMKSLVMQTDEGQIKNTHSIAAGLDYPSVGPEHSFLKETGRVLYTSATDDEAINAYLELTRKEGIIPALESSHALAATKKLAQDKLNGKNIVINLSGRGDKDMQTVNSYLESSKS